MKHYLYEHGVAGLRERERFAHIGVEIHSVRLLLTVSVED
jgi:hypothetical protein